MTVFWPVFWFIAGLILIIKGGDWFVDAAVWMAEVSGVPKIIIGATLVSLCTTLPELMVSTYAVMSGSPDMGVGNALGSVICNTGLILGISMIFLPSPVSRRDLFFKGGFLLTGFALLALMGADRIIAPREGALLAAVLAGYIAYSVLSARQARRGRDRPVQNLQGRDLILNGFRFVAGVTGIVVGARLLVGNGTLLARMAGISEQVIGLTIVALGTSLPELATTISAVVKKQFSLSMGNVLGANILNILLILSACSLLSPHGLVLTLQPVAGFGFPVPQSLYIDLPVAAALSLLVLIPGFLFRRLYRWQGITVMLGYAGYIAWLAVSVF